MRKQKPEKEEDAKACSLFIEKKIVKKYLSKNPFTSIPLYGII